MFALFALSSYSDAVKQISRMFVDTCVVYAWRKSATKFLCVKTVRRTCMIV